MTPTILVRDLHKAYRRGGLAAPVLRGLDLQTAAGECVFLAGPSGSGKTTLLSILGCVLTPDEGLVEILGHEVSRLSDDGRATLRRERIGFVFQRFQLIRGLNAAQNVAVPLALRGLPPKVAQARARELLAAVGLADQATSHPANMSTGQCQRVALARALVGDPELVLADEPTASLDAQNGQDVMRLLRRLTADQGKTAIVVTHDQRIFDFADRVLQLDGGRILPLPPGKGRSVGGRAEATLTRSASEESGSTYLACASGYCEARPRAGATTDEYCGIAERGE